MRDGASCHLRWQSEGVSRDVTFGRWLKYNRQGLQVKVRIDVAGFLNLNSSNVRVEFENCLISVCNGWKVIFSEVSFFCVLITKIEVLLQLFSSLNPRNIILYVYIKTRIPTISLKYKI